MLRKFVSALSSAAVAAGLVSGAVLTAPASATQTPPDVANPKLEGCGIPVTLVLDASGSIDDSEAAKMRSAASAFVNGLANTGSTARIVEFATTSKQLLARKNIAGQGLADLLAAIASYKSGGLGTTTNWESPLWRTFDEPIPGNKGLVVFMTDGDPNTIGGVGNPPSGTSGATDTVATAAAKVYSDQIKTAGNRMLAVGIGTTNDGQKGRLKEISGPNLVTTIPATATINDFDAVVTDSFDDLTAAMKRVAASLCGGSVTIRKLSDAVQPWDFQPVADWSFTATVSPGSVPNDFVWVLPPGETTTTASLTTDSNGVAQFQYAPKNTTTRTVRVSETVPETYYPLSYKCSFKGIDPPADKSGYLSFDGTTAYFDLTLKSDESASCDVKNQRTLAELKLVKQVEGADPDDWTLSAEANSPNDDRNFSTPGGSGVFETVYAGAEYTLGESGPGNYSKDGDWVCLAEPRDEVELAEADIPVNNGDKITLDWGDRVTCTITNKRDTAELKLVKQVASGSATADDFTLSATAAAPDNDLNFSNKGGSGDFTTVYAGTAYKLSESGPAGYTGSTWVCEGREVVPQVVQEGDTVTLNKNERVTCTIVNSRDTGSLTISKEFNPQGSGFTGTFDIAYSCVDGTTPVKSGTVTVGAGQSQTIPGIPTGAVCTVTEPTLPAAPAGWSFNPATFTPADGQATIGKDQAVTVRVVNSISQVNPVVVKRTCPIDPMLMTPKPKKSGKHILIKKIKTNSNCVLVKPVVLCKPIAASAAGETAFCDVTSRRSGRVKVDTDGYDAVRVTVVVRAKPKPGNADTWKPRTWRKSWVLR